MQRHTRTMTENSTARAFGETLFAGLGTSNRKNETLHYDALATGPNRSFKNNDAQKSAGDLCLRHSASTPGVACAPGTGQGNGKVFYNPYLIGELSAVEATLSSNAEALGSVFSAGVATATAMAEEVGFPSTMP